jgi:hypothetical protein
MCENIVFFVDHKHEVYKVAWYYYN